jgi:acyl dehydratase
MTGRFFEELSEGEVIHHSLTRTLSEMDNILFNSLTMNTQPLHMDEHFAQFGQRIVNGIFTLGLVVGITVNELTAGTIVANLGYESINHPHPLFHGDTIHVTTHILEKRLSSSNPSRGIIKMQHFGYNQDQIICVEVTRSALFLRKASET